MTVSVVPPANVEAGEYSIPVSAISAKENLKMDLQVHITGTYNLALSTPSGLLSLDAKANKASDVTLSVTNNSNVTLSNINLNSAAPTGWVVEFDTSADVYKRQAVRFLRQHLYPLSLPPASSACAARAASMTAGTASAVSWARSPWDPVLSAAAPPAFPCRQTPMAVSYTHLHQALCEPEDSGA